MWGNTHSHCCWLYEVKCQHTYAHSFFSRGILEHSTQQRRKEVNSRMYISTTTVIISYKTVNQLCSWWRPLWLKRPTINLLSSLLREVLKNISREQFAAVAWASTTQYIHSTYVVRTYTHTYIRTSSEIHMYVHQKKSANHFIESHFQVSWLE